MPWDVYVDGSYDSKQDKAAYAYAVVRYDIRFMEGYGIVEDTQGTRNISGELRAVAMALTEIFKTHANDREHVVIYYDYIGIEKWATGEWNANIPLTQDYSTFIQQMCSRYKISFKKVKSHSGDLWNSYVDKLCKKALNDEKSRI